MAALAARARAALAAAESAAPAGPPARPTRSSPKCSSWSCAGLTEPGHRALARERRESGRRRSPAMTLVALHKAWSLGRFPRSGSGRSRWLPRRRRLPPPPSTSPTPPVAEGTRQPAPAPAAPAAPPAPPVVAPAAPAPAPTASWPAPVAPPPPPAFPDGTVKVRLAVTYRPVLLEEEEPWTLFIYVDGRFLVSVEALRVPIPLPPKRFDVQLPPGRHVLRLAEERHLRYSRVRGYLSLVPRRPRRFPVQPSMRTRLPRSRSAAAIPASGTPARSRCGSRRTATRCHNASPCVPMRRPGRRSVRTWTWRCRQAPG